MPSSALPDDPVLSRPFALRSAAWAIGGALGRYLLAGITTLLLTHLLSPDAFGLIALTAVAQLFIEYIVPSGFHDALIQRKTISDADLNAAFWSVTLVSGAAVLLVIAGAPLIAHAFDQPRLFPLLTAVAAVSMLRASGTVPRALLNRRMDFRTLAFIRLESMTAAGLTAIGVGVIGGEAWSLVARLAAFNAISLVIIYRRVRWRPSFSTTALDRASLSALWRFAPSVTVFAALSYIITQADDQIIGLRLGSEALGYYALAFSLVAWPVQDVLGGAAGVLYPVFSRLQDDQPRLESTYLESLQLAALFAFPTLALLAVSAPVLVPWLLGPRWSPMILTVQILAFGGLREAASMFNGAIYRALNRPGLHALFEMGAVPCYLMAFIVGARTGIEGVALLSVITGILLQPLSLWLLLSLSGISLRRWFEAVFPATAIALLVTVTAGLTLWLVRVQLEMSRGPALLLTWSAVGIAVLVVLVLWTPNALTKPIQVIVSFVRKIMVSG